jgi:threonine/homoserine/homoserine lactone efflux protein
LSIAARPFKIEASGFNPQEDFMTSMAVLFAIAGIWAVIVLTPGPILLMTVRYAVAGRRMTAFQMALGAALADLVWAAGALMGLQALFATMAWVYDGLRLAGAALLIVIGARMIIASFRKPLSPAAPPEGQGRDRAVWRWGFATALANPKAVVFFSSLFLSLLPAQPSLAIQIAAVVTIGLVSLLCDFCVACAFSHPIVQAAYGRARHWIDRIAGGILIAVGLRVAIAR